jgi:hypothetical protein
MLSLTWHADASNRPPKQCSGVFQQNRHVPDVRRTSAKVREADLLTTAFKHCPDRRRRSTTSAGSRPIERERPLSFRAPLLPSGKAFLSSIASAVNRPWLWHPLASPLDAPLPDASPCSPRRVFMRLTHNLGQFTSCSRSTTPFGCSASKLHSGCPHPRPRIRGTRDV